MRVSLLGRARAALLRARANSAPVAGRTVDEPATSGRAHATGVQQVARDLLTIALLVRNNVGVFRQFRGIGARLVHANDLNVLLAGYLLARVWKAPLLYDSHELWTQLDESWSPLLRRLFERLEGPLLRRAEAVVTVNSAIARELAQLYGTPPPLVVMNCPEFVACPEAERVAQVRPLSVATGTGGESAPCASPPLAVIYQGVLDARGRGLEGLIDAAASADGINLTLRGPGSLAEPLQRRIEMLGAHNVRIAPPVPMADLVRALDGYDVGVVSYLPLSKNFLFCSPNKLFEYMMAGLAVVCSDLPVLREVVSDADCGLLYEAGDVGSLAAALRRLAQDRSLLARYRANALRAARERYNATVEEGRLLRAYSDLLPAAEQRGRRRS
jgi:glycosyltransferase involved in cell wall biosynthesis